MTDDDGTGPTEQSTLALEECRWQDLTESARRKFSLRTDTRGALRESGAHVVQNQVRYLANDLDDLLDGPLQKYGTTDEALAIARTALLELIDDAQRMVIAYMGSATPRSTHVCAEDLLIEQRQRVRTAVRRAAQSIREKHKQLLPEPLSDLKEPPLEFIGEVKRTIHDVIKDSANLPRKGKRGRPSARAHYLPLFEGRKAGGLTADTPWAEAQVLSQILSKDPLFATTPRATAKTIYNVIRKMFAEKM